MKFHNLTLFFLLVSLLSGYIKESLIILIIVVLHELGHAIVIKALGYHIEEIEIYPFGGLTKIDKPINDHILNDLLIAIAGVLVQLVLLILCKIDIIVSSEFYKYNLAIMLFNLLPIIPLDGSKIVLELCHFLMPYQKALNFYIWISLISTIIYFAFNYHYMLNNYLIIMLFIYKTYETFKNKKIYYYKFLLERRLYNIKYRKIVNKNTYPSKYKKDIKYYYFIKGKVMDEKTYLDSNYSNN